jgi:diguanylate cyclase (GGDEF)-like protein
MSNLALWERSQGERLAHLRESVADRDVLNQLLETSCLLELSKLVCAQPTLAVYAELTLKVITEFFPVGGCALVLETAGVPKLTVARGDTTGEEGLRLPLRTGAGPVGFLVVAGERGGAEPAFFEAVAGHLSQGLGAILDAEQLRRRLASSLALRLATTFADGPDQDRLDQLANALSTLPGALGARLRLPQTPPAEGLTATAGFIGLGPATASEVPTSAGPCTVEVTWAEEPLSGDASVLDDILAALGHALAQWEEQRRLRELSETDPLTELGNRRRAHRELAAALNRAERFEEPVAVLALDLDNFKRVNDTLGHPAGDDVLRALADVLRTQLRLYDTPARMGGEEFLVICPSTNGPGARALAQRLLQAVPEACAQVLPEGWRQTTSIGVAVYPEQGRQVDGLLRAADQALYASKCGGRNRLTVAAAR